MRSGPEGGRRDQVDVLLRESVGAEEEAGTNGGAKGFIGRGMGVVVGPLATPLYAEGNAERGGGRFMILLSLSLDQKALGPVGWRISPSPGSPQVHPGFRGCQREGEEREKVWQKTP